MDWIADFPQTDSEKDPGSATRNTGLKEKRLR
jgi:hypothetical protein